MKLLDYLLRHPVGDENENCLPTIVTSVTSVTGTAACGPPEPTPEPSECGPDCYGIEPGRRIHRPWPGKCRTRFETREPRQIERQCWHCHGSTRCACIPCCEGLPAGSETTCMVCKGTGKALVWVH